MTREILRVPDVLEMLGVSRRSLCRWRASGAFPEPLRLGPNSVGWRRSDIEAWIESRPSAAEAV